MNIFFLFFLIYIMNNSTKPVFEMSTSTHDEDNDSLSSDNDSIEPVEPIEPVGYDSSKVSSQSQSHGFIWENVIREQVFGLSSVKNDTSKYDIDCHHNKFCDHENISIKTSGSDNIDCGDVLRFFDYDFDKKNTIILLRYIQHGDFKMIKQTIELDYSLEVRNILFGSISYDELKDFVDIVKSVPPGKIDADKHKMIFDRKKEMQINHNMYIRICPKIDSKNQRRVQCSIPKINVLFEKHPKFVISHNYGFLLRSVSLGSGLFSPKRKRSKH